MAFKAMILVGLVALLAACGGSGPDSPSRLSLEQMRSWCTEFNDRGEEKFGGIAEEEATWGDAVEAFEFSQDSLANVTPPGELEGFWEAWQRTFEAALSFSRPKPAGEPMQLQDILADTEVLDAQRALIDIQTSLSGEASDVALHCSG